MMTKVKPGHHGTVAYDLRKRIKEAFDRHPIEIPFPRRVVILENEDTPRLLKNTRAPQRSESRQGISASSCCACSTQNPL